MATITDEKKLEEVTGGTDAFGFGLTFAQCTQLLKEAGDRAYDRSGFSPGPGCFIPGSNLHTYINRAEKTNDVSERITNVDNALLELKNPTTAHPGFVDLKLQPGDYEFIETRLLKVKLESAITPEKL